MEFVNFVFSKEQLKNRVTYIAHYGGKFDIFCILKPLYEQKRHYETILRGQKILELTSIKKRV